LMALPVPEWWSRKFLANSVAAAERSFSQISIPSSLTENATRSVVAAGCAAFQAVLRASMIGPSGIRVRADGVCGDWPCLADRMMAVLFSRCRSWVASIMAPTLVLT
jgi:hypothetical protein